MLGWRLAISAVLIPLLFGLFWLDHRVGASAPWLFGLALLLGVRSTWELTHLLRIRAMSPSFFTCAAGVWAILIAAWIPHWAPPALPAWAIASLGIALATLAAFYIVVVKAAIRFREPGKTMDTIGAELTTIVYCGTLLALTAQLRWAGDGHLGYAALGSLLVAVKTGDIGGYTLGRLFGKRKMAPWLSPGKTWAGFFGALMGATAGVWLWITYAAPLMIQAGSTYHLVNVLAFGLSMGMIGLLGDLCESLIKRDVGQKDAAALFPGFGGLLDLLDSILFAGPIAWIWWMLWPLIQRQAGS